MSNNITEKRSREWTFILYPESAPEDWETQLRDEHINCVISPLHKNDKNPDGELKKAHYHILLSFNSVKGFNQVKQITDKYNQPIPQIVSDKSAMVRYFIHLDHPEKYQYSKEDIKTIGQVDLDLYFKKSKSEKTNICKEIISFCKLNHIEEFHELVDYCIENNSEWFEYLTTQAWLIREYLFSFHCHKKEERLYTFSNGTESEKLIQQIEDL